MKKKEGILRKSKQNGFLGFLRYWDLNSCEHLCAIRNKINAKERNEEEGGNSVKVQTKWFSRLSEILGPE